jgi:hypothetical protein
MDVISQEIVRSADPKVKDARKSLTEGEGRKGEVRIRASDDNDVRNDLRKPLFKRIERFDGSKRRISKVGIPMDPASGSHL